MNVFKIMLALAALLMAIALGFWALENNPAMLLAAFMLLFIPLVLIFENLADKVSTIVENFN